MKSKLIIFLLWVFLRWLSMHRFYSGKTGSGILYLFTGQLLGVGWVVDFFLLGIMVDACNSKIKIKNLEKVVLNK